MPRSPVDRFLLALFLLSVLAALWMTDARRPDTRAFCEQHLTACVPDSLVHWRH